ncbi:hypothetical protein GAYE_SCF34G5001 [Galdieria yellowstonensis]|uniref:Uncharacterized protein n=1 Tax=Galdieria yellowstonensis TaxID=3028027 RepID=A0AAV9II47_9RHOD|nr:hypothetical protein GAYE_SCF34G5001 [Galdieria yellowstonensis]
MRSPPSVVDTCDIPAGVKTSPS